ncbi:MAG: M56 family metallopeptidase [Oscillospiraceae bacterium]|nr:M56 family metallopeptidase [Oscillospiraceae bacterium]
MADIFSAVLRMSFAGSAVTLLLFASQKIAKGRLSAKWRYYSGIAAMIFLLLPIDARILPFGEKISPFAFGRSSGQKSETAETGKSGPAADIEFKIGDSETKPDSPAAENKPKINAKDILGIAAYVWLSGIAVLSVTKAAKYAQSKKYLKKGAFDLKYSEIYGIFTQCKHELKIRRNIGLRRHGGISTPMAAGLFEPVVYLPDITLEKDEIRLILKHELIHVKRCDLWYKFIFMAARVVHWFNPLCFLLERETGISCELSCDETLVKNMGKSGKKFYCRTILNAISAAGAKLSVIHATMGNTRKQIERRFENMLNYKKGTVGTVITSIILLSAIVGAGVYVAAISSPKAAQIQDGKSENENLLIGAGETKANESGFYSSEQEYIERMYYEPFCPCDNCTELELYCLMNCGGTDLLLPQVAYEPTDSCTDYCLATICAKCKTRVFSSNHAFWIDTKRFMELEAVENERYIAKRLDQYIENEEERIILLEEWRNKRQNYIDKYIDEMAGEPATDTVPAPQPDWRVREMYERGYRESLEYTKFKDSSFNQRMIDLPKEENDFIYECLCAGDIEMICAIADDISGLHTYDADGRMMVALELEDGRRAEFEIKFE